MLGRIAGVAVGAVLAGAASQVPEYAQQYRQRLGGAVEELRLSVQTFDADARSAGLSREQAIAEYARSGSVFLDVRGERVLQVIRRFEALEAQQRALQTADSFERLLVFARGHDEAIARAAWQDYEPAIPATLEGLVHAAAGFAGGLLAGGGVGAALALPFRRRRRRGDAAGRP